MTGYIYGLDPASKNDFFGIVVHELKELPKLRAINKLNHTSFDRLYDYLVNNMFERYPPRYICIDYSNEKTFADMLVKIKGKEKVELIPFTTGNKLMLKQDGLSILKQGYKFPRPSKLEPTVAQYVAELTQQLKQEQMLETKTGKTTFDHPSGQHNDLAIAWELSIHGCLRFMMKRKKYFVAVSREFSPPSSLDPDFYEHSMRESNPIGSAIPNRPGITPISKSVWTPG